MKNLTLIYWFIFNPLRYYVYRIRFKQGLSIEYSYNFVNERKHSELMAFLRMTDYDKIRGINLIKK